MSEPNASDTPFVSNEDDSMNQAANASDALAKELDQITVWIAIGTVALGGVCVFIGLAFFFWR